ncbi:MAG: transposase [Anaerolineae bacterium]|nr:transposase [Anaerolineae bacterium]
MSYDLGFDRHTSWLQGGVPLPVQAYFLTLRVFEHECVLGRVIQNEVHLTDIGQAVAQTWGALPSCLPPVKLDAFVVMPNCVHGIVLLPRSSDVPDLKTVMRAFKSLSSLACNQLLGRSGGRFWERGFEEYALSNEDELKQARHYIAGKPSSWGEDDENYLCQQGYV